MSKILSEMDLHANLMGMLCPKDSETSAACLRAVLDSHDAMQAQLDAVLAEAVWAMESILLMNTPTISGCLDDDASEREDATEDYQRAVKFLASPVVAAWRKRQKKEPVAADLKQTVRRSCNLHQDCDVADREGKKQHCRVEDCEDCYGQ